MQDEHTERQSLEHNDVRDAESKRDLLRKLKQTHQPEAEGPCVQIVIVALNEQLYGIKILAVREIMKVSKMTWVPWTPEFVIGVISLRGDIQCVVDLKHFLQIGTSQLTGNSRIILVESKELITGLLVDAMVDIIEVPVRTFLPFSEGNVTASPKYIEGKVPWKEEMITLLDIDMLLQGVVVNQG